MNDDVRTGDATLLACPPAGLVYLDSPSTTSATTYSTRIIEYGSGTSYAQSDSSPTMMTLMEIAGWLIF